MTSLSAFARSKLDALESRSLRRTLTPTRRLEGPWVERGGKRLLSFSCNDYLNLTTHPTVKAASAQAVLDHGTGAGASRLVTGDHPLLGELEKRLARLKGTKAACLFSSGYMANLGAIPTFVGPGDAIFIDETSHACLWAGARLSGATVFTFDHNSTTHLSDLLSQHRSLFTNAIVLTEGVFSMDGDLAPLGEISAVAQAHDAWLLTDDAHGVGVLADGRGSAALFPEARIDLQMGTLSKALASAGGYVCGSREAIDLLKTRARTVIYTTSLPPASAAAALASLDVIEGDPELCATPLAKARAFTRAANLPEAQSPIVPIILGEPQAALEASRALEAEGFLVVAIRPPTVPAGTARLRLAFSAGQPDEEIARLASLMRTFL